MATSPRPGIIQLEHPSVYQAARQAQQDDWLRQGMGIGGDYLQKRNTDIKYNRAEGLPEDRMTAREHVVDKGKMVGKGLGKAWDAAKDWAGEAWDTVSAKAGELGDMLRAPDVEPAPTQTVGYREEVGSKRATPIPENPEDIVDEPGDVLQAPDVVSTVDGLPSTSKAAPGQRVTFPMTVAGTVEKSMPPDTIGPKPGMLQAPDATPAQQAPANPPAPAQQAQAQVPAGMLQAPNYSEMFRLDPKRAEFDWGRERDLMTNETRQRTAGRNVQAMKMANAEHDIPIRQEMEEKAIRLFEDVRSGALDKNSSEYVSRRGELGLLNAKLYTPYNKTSFDKLLSEGVVDKALGLREEGMDLDRDKEKQRILESTSKFAESAGKQIMSGYGDLLKKIETRASMLESFREGTLEAIASKSSATFAAALKSLIQSLDNSVVMAKEWGPFQNASYLDQAKAWLEKQSNNTTFSGEEMRQAWVTAKAWAASTKTVVAQAQDTAVDQAVNYPGLRRLSIDPKEVSSYVDAALEAYVPKSDFDKEPEWPAVLDMSSPTLREGAGAVGDLVADPKGDAGLPVDPMAVVPKKKKKKKPSAPAVPMATEDDLW